MCILYIAVNNNSDNLKLNYCIESLNYNSSAGELISNISFFLTNTSKEPQAIALIHTKPIGYVKALNFKKDYDFLRLLCDVYDGRLSFNIRNQTVEFFSKPKELSVDEDHLKKIPFLIDLPMNKELCSDDLNRRYTKIRIDNFPPGKTAFYSIHLEVSNGKHSIDGREVPSGPFRYLRYRSNDWKSLDIPKEQIITPQRHDVLIQNKKGMLPKCYRLDSNVHQEFIRDKELASKVAWFNSPDPHKDFSIALSFS